MVRDMVMISRIETKLDEITVTLQSINPKKPTITSTVMMQQPTGRATQRNFLKNRLSTRIRKASTPNPNVSRSCSMKPIMSEVIMGTPPRNISACSRCRSMMSRTVFIIWSS